MNGIGLVGRYAAGETTQVGDGTQAGGGTPPSGESGQSFAEVLSDIMKTEAQVAAQSATLSSLSGGESSGSGFMSGDYMGSLVSSLFDGGEMNLESALLFMCTVMGDSLPSEFSMMLGLFADAVSRTEKKEQIRLKSAVMSSGASSSVKETVLNSVFAGASAVPSSAWVKTSPTVTGNEHSRSAGRLRAVIDQFDVENSERYRPYRRGSDTYCNIFVWDVTSALGCEIPHYVDRETGETRIYPDVKGAKELTAGYMQAWLLEKGPQNGWHEVDAETAQAYANAGRPAVASYRDFEKGNSHIQMVCPSRDGGYDPIRGVTVAQAGGNNYSYKYISSTYKSSVLSQVRYFVHE